MPTKSTFTAAALSALLLGGCSSSEDVASNNSSSPYYDGDRPTTLAPHGIDQINSSRFEALTQYFEEWKGTPYRWGGASKKGIDCSAFTQQAYAAVFAHTLPRTTSQQLTQGNKIPLNTADQGDLIFFKTGSRRYHVGIYLGEKQFMHASSSKGVIISRVDNPYWSARLLQVRRYPVN
ncbi:C40 family peptidase [Enterovibrio paralichthyis]|uniref:C40 family peptidase n=1 Tax=Enterovibrio paralichthyis TaxID=2853805 RepID=UPI0006D28EB5|nr:NlpC/P60 family protein [Enterovibrio paralichthyis]MBV7296538.1 C40 family peptidase [Enterovibrio paralichthyis]